MIGPKLRCTRHSVQVPHLPAGLDGLRVAQLSDLHRSHLTSDRLLHQAVAHVCAWQPDLILLTGDFVGDNPADIAPCMHILRPLTARWTSGQAVQTVTPGSDARSAPGQWHGPRLGLFAVPGNHDVLAGTEQTRQALAGLDIRMLCNEHVRIADGLWLVGLDEDWFGTPQPARAFADVPPDAATLVMAHNPGEVDGFSERACVVFSGHTHGGQIRLPLLTAWMLRYIKAKRYRAGWYTVNKAQMYVNQGLGCVNVPVRFLCPPEVAFFTMRGSREEGSRAASA